MREQRAAIAEKEQLEALERDLAAARELLHEREQQLAKAHAALYERDFELQSARKELARRDDLFDSWRGTVRQHEQELVNAEARLMEAELRAERLEGSLTSVRSGRAYRLMRIAWRLRRPLHRSG